MDESDLIDNCISYISEIKGVYLAKEDKILYWASLTGSKTDLSWQSLTLEETRRIISSRDVPVKCSHIITALQELDVVYDMGVNSPYTVAPNLFNMSSKNKVPVLALIISSALAVLQQGKNDLIIIDEFYPVIKKVCNLLNVKNTINLRAAYLKEYCLEHGYTFYYGKARLTISRKKHTALIRDKSGLTRSGLKMSDITHIHTNTIAELTTARVRKLTKLNR